MKELNQAQEKLYQAQDLSHQVQYEIQKTRLLMSTSDYENLPSDTKKILGSATKSELHESCELSKLGLYTAGVLVDSAKKQVIGNMETVIFEVFFGFFFLLCFLSAFLFS